MDTDLPLPAPSAPPEAPAPSDLGGAFEGLLAAVAELQGISDAPGWALGLTIAEGLFLLAAMVIGALVARRASKSDDAE